MFQRKEREVVTDVGSEAKNVRSKNNWRLLKGKVQLSVTGSLLRGHGRGGRQCSPFVWACEKEPVSSTACARPWGPHVMCGDESQPSHPESSLRPSRDPHSTSCKWGNNTFESLYPTKEHKNLRTLEVWTELSYSGEGSSMRRVMAAAADFLKKEPSLLN